MSLLAPEEGFDQLLLGEDHGVVLLDKIELSGISGKLQMDKINRFGALPIPHGSSARLRR